MQSGVTPLVCVELAPILRPVALDHQVACHFDIGGASQ
jgi:hypothetical protein